LQEIKANLSQMPMVSVTSFVPDERKEGGFYETVCGRVKKLDEYGGRIVLEDDTSLDIAMICKLERS